MTEEIRFFIREEPYGFLSNFERSIFKGKSMFSDKVYLYPTNEHYYQAQKANCQEMHDYIMSAPHARVAMVLGRQVEHNKYLRDKYMRPEWDTKKLEVMLTGLREKFRTPRLRKMLLDTGDAVLHEDNPEDFYWGIADGTGESMLGKCLMQIREEIRTSIEADNSTPDCYCNPRAGHLGDCRDCMHVRECGDCWYQNEDHITEKEKEG